MVRTKIIDERLHCRHGNLLDNLQPSLFCYLTKRCGNIFNDGL